MRHCGERQDYGMHEDVDAGAVDDAKEHWTRQQEGELAAGEIVSGRRPKGDHEVQEDSENSGCHSLTVRLRAEHSTGYRLWNQDRARGRVNHDRVSEIENSDDESADGNGVEGSGGY